MLSDAIAFPVGTRFDNEFDYQYAYRLYGSYAFCDDHDFQLIWTHLPKTHHSTSASGTLGATSGMPLGILYSFASSRIDLQYYSADALIGCWGNQCNALSFMFRTGLHYANFIFEEAISYRGGPGVPPDNLDFHSHTWGIGPEIAAELDYNLPFLRNCLCGDLTLTSRIKGGLLVSHYHNTFDRVTAAMVVQPFSNDQHRWDVLPVLDIQMGLSYGRQFGCFQAIVEIGYEVLSYRNIIPKAWFAGTGGAGGLSVDLYSDVNFQGPYLALEFMF